MATLDDLSSGIVTVLSGLLFPGQNYLPGAIATVTSPWTGAPGAAGLTIPVRLFRGSMEIADQNADITAGTCDVAVNPVPGMNRNSTRFQPYYKTTSANRPTLNVAWSEAGATFGGICASGQVVGITVNRVCYAYRTTAADTPATVAANLAALIPGATVAGAVLTCAPIQSAIVVCDQQGILCMGQQQQMVRVGIYAPNVPSVGAGPLVRAAIARVVDRLKSLQRPDGSLTRFIELPDGSKAKICPHHDADDDTPRVNNIWRRWSYFHCEYDETIPVLQPTLITTNILMRPGVSGLVWAGAAPYVANVATDGVGNVLGDAAGRVLGSVT